MTMHIGWWAIPATITAIAIGSLLIPGRAPSGYGDIGMGVIAAFHLLAAVIVSLVAWLIWALSA